VTPRLSFNTWNHSAVWDLPPTLPEQITAAAAAGYDHIGLDVPSLLAHEAAGLTAEQIRAHMDEVGISSFELVPLPLSADPAATEEGLARVVRFAPILGAHQVLAVVDGEVTGRTIVNIRRCVEQLAALGVGTAIEFLPSVPVNSIEAVERLLDAVDRPEARVMVDTWHFFVGPSTWEALDALPPDRLGFVQFCDGLPAQSTDVRQEYRQRRVLPGEGIHGLAAFADHVLARWPDVVVSVEVLSSAWRSRPVEEFAAATYRSTRQFWPVEVHERRGDDDDGRG